MKKVPNVPSLASKALEIIVSVSKQKLYIRIQKEMKLAFTKNPDCTLLDKKLGKIVIFSTLFLSS